MKLRRIIVFLLALFILGYDLGQRVQASTTLPGSAEDPIVTVGYVKDYLEKAFKPVSDKLYQSQNNLNYVASRVNKVGERLNPKIIFVIGSKTASIGNKKLSMEAAPIIYNNRTILPLRFIGEALGAQILWDNKTKKITYIKEKNVIVLYLNKTDATVNGKTVKLDAAPITQNSRTLVPVRFISENLNAKVDYISKTKTIIVKGK